MLIPDQPIKGRGAAENPANRFEKITLERDVDWDPSEDPLPRTQFFKDSSSSLITTNDSPDIPFEASFNVYRGCEHGCIYCYARPGHEFLGFSAGLDFETKIMVKENAPELLRKELMSPRWKPKVLAMSGVTDCYQPAERRFRLTRRCLEVLAEFRNPVGIVTKNHLVTRDVDILQQLAAFKAATVYVTITTLDADLAARLEPRASLPAFRLETIRKLAAAGIPTGVMVAPVIPGLTDHEMPEILKQAAGAGAKWSGYVLLRLPHGLDELFVKWLDRHCPLAKDKVLNRLRSMRGGELYQGDFGTRMTGEGPAARQIRDIFQVCTRRAGINNEELRLETAHFRRPGEQLSLF